jgi:hypothetical protein
MIVNEYYPSLGMDREYISSFNRYENKRTDQSDD